MWEINFSYKLYNLLHKLKQVKSFYLSDGICICHNYLYKLCFSNGPTRLMNLKYSTWNMALDSLKTFYIHHPYIYTCSSVSAFNVLSYGHSSMHLLEFSWVFLLQYLFYQISANITCNFLPHIHFKLL